MPWTWHAHSTIAPTLLAAALVAQGAAANEPASSFRLAWVRGEGADGCVDERTLERGVRARLGRDPFSAEASQSIEGDISARSGGFRAKLRVRDAAGALAGRRELDVDAAECGKLTDAVVLAVALVIDPRATLAPPRAEPPPSSAPEPAKLEPEAVDAPAGPPPLSRECSAPVPCPACRARECPPCRAPECPERSALSLRASLRGLGAAGVLPGLAPGVGTSAALGISRFRFVAGVSTFPERDRGHFAFGLTTTHLGACASAEPLGPLTAAVCAQFQAGSMHAVVRELEPLRPGDHLWAAVGFGPEITVAPLAPLVVELSVLGLLPVRRPRFAVRGDADTVFESAGFGAVVGVGVGVLVP